MIKVFGQTDTSLSSNGDVVLLPIKAKVYNADNGDFYLEIETGLQYVDYLVEGNIIVAPTPQGEQAFRITNPQKTKTKISVKAWHVFFDSKNYLIADIFCRYFMKHRAVDNNNPVFNTLCTLYYFPIYYA